MTEDSVKARWYALGGINPEPWTASEASTGMKHGKTFVNFHKSPQLRVYQNAIKDEMELQYGEVVPTEKPIVLWFYFWRDLTTGIGERISHSHVADVTNMQKALEDALQGILYVNDTQVVEVHSRIMRQRVKTLPRILIGVSELITQPKWADDKVKTMLDAQRQVAQAQAKFNAPDADIF